MKNVKKIAKEILSQKSKKVLKIEINDPEDQLFKLIEYIKDIGNVGHSFEIVVDPKDSETKKSFGWDGDGSARIDKIEKTEIKD